MHRGCTRKEVASPRFSSQAFFHVLSFLSLTAARPLMVRSLFHVRAATWSAFFYDERTFWSLLGLCLICDFFSPFFFFSPLDPCPFLFISFPPVFVKSSSFFFSVARRSSQHHNSLQRQKYSEFPAPPPPPPPMAFIEKSAPCFATSLLDLSLLSFCHRSSQRRTRFSFDLMGYRILLPRQSP